MPEDVMARRYTASHYGDGEITGQRSDAMSEPGNPLVFILFSKPGPGDVQGYPE
jgi:hypothetical protein